MKCHIRSRASSIDSYSHSFRTLCYLGLFLLVTWVPQALGQGSNVTCQSKTTCGECFRSPDCVWCAQPEFRNAAGAPLDRCNTPTIHQAHPENIRCGTRYLLSAKNEFFAYRDEPITKGSRYQQTIQIRPQNVSIKLRVGQAYDLRIQYEQAEDYPVDLYYLMDLSKSMEDDKETLSELGTSLAQTMRSLTSNFRLGFGSFVDKVVMPYVSTVERNLLQPCPGCEAVYGYQNIMTLDDDTSRFAGEVRRARVSGNLDAPEGGFDAIMQAIVCEDQIGWRKNNTRRLLVFSTDASFHYAGDGKLGGIVKPNDGKCHMDNKGEYTHSTILDYPSVAQINSKVKEKSINMIFAVTAEQVSIYQRLAQSIQGSTCGELSANSSNVVELVKEEYQKITSEVKLRDTASGVIRVSYFSTCLGEEMIETNKCSGLQVGKTVTFVAKIEILECPKNEADWKQTFDIYVVGLEEKLTVNLEMLCKCDCEIPGNPGYEIFSPFCNNVGTNMCGACFCDFPHFGRVCECDSRRGALADDDRACRLDNATDIVCQGRGRCACGICECNVRPDPEELIDGKFCECDNFLCERENGQLCSGIDHGHCVCGKCVCLPGWTGSSCACSTETDACYEPGKTDRKDICSGKGTCKCGACECNSTETELYSGRYCEKCPTCPDRCNELMHCVQCTVHKSGDFKEAELCRKQCENYPEIAIADEVTNDESSEEKYCQHIDESNKCRFYYVYGYDSVGKLYIRAQQTEDCPPDPPLGWIIFGVVGAIVLIGLVFLLIWKLLTHIHDRAEYARFEKERQSAKWDAGENPIYKQATSTFKNPMYAGR